MKGPKKTHKQGPHVEDALDASTGKPDKAKLAAGAAAWLKAIQDGDVEIVSASETIVDENTDVITFVRRIVKQ